MSSDEKPIEGNNSRLSPRHTCAYNHLFKLRASFSGDNRLSPNSGPSSIAKRIHIPEDRIIRYPLSSWLSKLQHKIVNLIDESEVAVLVNQTSFVMALLGNIECAYAICNKGIEYYYSLYKLNNHSHLLCEAIQPWINMARLQRICQNFALSNRMFQFLSGEVPPSTRIERIVKIALDQAKAQNNLHSKVADNCCRVEPLYNAITQKDFATLSNLLGNYRSRDFIRFPSLREAEIISQFYNENFVQYKINVFCGFNLCRIQDLDAFSLRLAEYFHLQDDVSSRKLVTNSIFDYCHSLMSHTQDTIEHAHLVLCILQSMQTFAETDFIYELSVKLLNLYRELNDEPGKIATLQMICSLPRGAKYQERLTKCLAATDYVYLKNSSTVSCAVKMQSEQLVTDFFKILDATRYTSLPIIE